LHDLHPTQITLGKRKVEQKRAELKAMAAKERDAHMAAQLYPAVKGPSKKYYMLITTMRRWQRYWKAPRRSSSASYAISRS
jgi:hypothetical protein